MCTAYDYRVGVGKAYSKIILMGEHWLFMAILPSLFLKDIEVVPLSIQAAEIPLTLKAQDP